MHRNSNGILFPPCFLSSSSSYITLPANWDILAPFSIGTREFGADPLEAFGGIRKLYTDRASPQLFPSELVFGGYVGWSSVPGGTSMVNIQWNATMVNWPLIESWGGLAASQFQGWAVGRISIQRSGTYTVSCVGVSTFYIGEQSFRGDVYGLGYGVFSANLEKSNTVLMYIPFGGMEGTSFQCGFNDVSPSSASKLQELSDHVIPDIIVYNGQNNVAGGWFGLSVLNLYNMTLSQFRVTSNEFTIMGQEQPSSFSLEGHQAGIFNFQVDSNSVNGIAQCQGAATTESHATFRLIFTAEDATKGWLESSSLFLNVTLNCRSWGLPYAFTFLDVDHSVQYAAARPPINRCSSSGCGVLFTFHGAGVYARKDAWVYAYQQQKTSWLLFPTNRRQFGFDWEGPGKTNAWMALEALSAPLSPGVPLSISSSFKVNKYRIQYAGHSMGGHGCWLISSHAPDRALSISPAAGWIKMGMYIPFFSRTGDSLVDPFLSHLLMSSISMHNTDFYMRNLKGIPLMVRMGALDNNVPPFHLKRMARIHNQINSDPTWTVISEIPGESHWWGGVVDDAAMQAFFDKHVNKSLPPLPNSFTVSTLSPSDFESKGGIQPLQFFISGRAGYIHVSGAGTASPWTLTTHNIRRFRFLSFPGLVRPSSAFILVDGQQLISQLGEGQHYCKNVDNLKGSSSAWDICWDRTGWMKVEKSRESLGPIPRILEGPITIVYGTKCPDIDCANLYRQSALTIANTLYYQGRYTPSIFPDFQMIGSVPNSNLIILGDPQSNAYLNWLISPQKSWKVPVQFLTETRGFQIGERSFTHPSSATAFIAPLPDTYPRMALVLAGNTNSAMRKAITLVPTKSSWTLPDWVATGPEFGWNGAAGLLGAGYWSFDWKFDPSNSWISPFDEF
jgi:hypothetical protein